MFRPFELALYSEGMFGLPGSLKKEYFQQVPEVWASGKTGSRKMSPSGVRFGWERSLRSKLRGQITSLAMTTPVGICPKRRRRSGGWRETGVFALSLIVEKQPGRSVSTCPEGPCVQLEGALPRQRPGAWKGTDKREPCRSQPTSKVKALFLLGLYKILQKASVSLGTSVWFPGTSSRVNTYTKRRGLKLWPVDGMKVLWTCFRSGVNCVTLDSPLLTAFILSLTLAFAYTPSFRTV